MLRLVELVLFLTPFAVFIVWRFLAIESIPSVGVMVGAACVLAVLVGALIWLGQEDTVPSGMRYAPARLEHGKIVSDQGAPP